MKKTSPIEINSDIDISFSQKTVSHIIFPEIVCMILTIFACVLTLKDSFFMPINFFIVLAIIIFPTAFTLILHMKKHCLVTFLGAFAAIILPLFYYASAIKGGIILLNAQVITAINKFFHQNYAYEMQKFSSNEADFCLTILMVSLIFLLTVIFSLIIIKTKAPVLVALGFSPFAYACITFHVGIYASPLVIFLCVFIIIYVMGTSTEQPRGKRISENFVRKNKTIGLYHEPFLQSGATRNSVAIVLATVIILGTITLAMPYHTFKNTHENTPLDKSIESVKHIFSGGSFDKLYVPGLSELLSANKSNAGIGGGNLMASTNISYSNKTHLEIATDKKPTPFLLKAYVGSTFDGKSWNELSISTYNDYQNISDVFDGKFNEYAKEFFDCALDQVHLKENKLITFPDFSAFNLTIKNVRASKDYCYLPYFSTTKLSNSNKAFDSFFTPSHKDDTKLYSANTYQPLLFPTASLKADELYNKASLQMAFLDNNQRSKKLIDAKDAYQNFAKDYYTILPKSNEQFYKNLSNEIMSNQEMLAKIPDGITTKDGVKTANTDSVVVKINMIKAYLQQNTTYSLTPGKVPKNTDPIEYFLLENKRGFCMHYATAATLLLRAQGVPARYVEGYTVTENDIANAKSNKKSNHYSMNIKDTNAHSWVEVFNPIIGWTPVEFTPGYSGAEVNLLNTQTADQTSKSEISSEQSSTTSSEVSSEISSEQSSKITSSAEISSAPSSSANPTKPLDISATISTKKTTTIIFFVGAIILFFTSLFIRRIIILHLRKKSFNLANSNKSALLIYKYIKKILNEFGAEKIVYINSDEYAKTVSNEIKIAGSGIIKATSIADKATFSQHKITLDEINFMQEYANNLSTKAYEKFNFAKKIFAKYFKII